MPFKVLTLAFDPVLGGFDQTALESFCANKTIHTVQPQLFQQHGKTYWSVWVEYDAILPPAEKRKTNEQLDPLQQQLFEHLRSWRKEKAEDTDVPAFVVANDRELIAVVKSLPNSTEALSQLNGFGTKKIKKYGEELLKQIKPYIDAKQDSHPDEKKEPIPDL